MYLSEYLEKYDVNISEFCRNKKINKNTFYSVLKGKPMHISTAKRIEEATYGQVTVNELINSISNKSKEPQIDKRDTQ